MKGARGGRNWTSPPHSTGRRFRLTQFADGWTAIGLLGEGDRSPAEVFGPLTRDECAGLAHELLAHELLANNSCKPGGGGAATRFDDLASAMVDLIRLERGLQPLVRPAESEVVDAALGTLRAILSDLVAFAR